MLESIEVRVGILLLELHIPEARSLKTKRKSIKSLKEKISARCNVSVAEVGFLDKWQRSAIGITAISNDERVIEKQFQYIQELLQLYPEMEVLDARVEFI